MGNKQIRQSPLFLKVFQHIDNLSLNRYIQRGDRFITDDELRIYRKSSCDTDTLSLSTGKLVRETGHMVFV